MDLKFSMFNSVFELFATFNFAYTALEPVKREININIIKTLTHARSQCIYSDDLKNFRDSSSTIQANERDFEGFNLYFKKKYGYSMSDILIKFSQTEYHFRAFIHFLGLNFQTLTKLSSERNNSSELKDKEINELSIVIQQKYLPIFFYYGLYCLLSLFIGGIADGLETSNSAIKYILYFTILIFNIISIVSTIIYSLREQSNFSVVKTTTFFISILVLSCVLGSILANMYEKNFFMYFDTIKRDLPYKHDIIILTSLLTVVIPFLIFFVPPYLESYYIKSTFDKYNYLSFIYLQEYLKYNIIEANDLPEEISNIINKNSDEKVEKEPNPIKNSLVVRIFLRSYPLIILPLWFLRRFLK